MLFYYNQDCNGDANISPLLVGVRQRNESNNILKIQK